VICLVWGGDMEYVLLPVGLLDLPEVADLSADHKFVLAAVSAHPKLTAAAVLSCTSYFLAQLPLPQDVFWGIAFDLERRGIVTADLETREIFIRRSFDWHRAPAPGEESPWARQVRAAAARICSCKVKEAVFAALAAPPEARLSALKIPSNLLTAMPFRAAGQSWTATEILVHFASALDPCQTPAGVFRPALPALAAFCSLPLPTLLECINTLLAAEGIFFDRETGELFSPARFRCAQERDLGKIKVAAAAVVSKPIFRAFERAAKRRFPEIRFESMACFPGEGREVECKRKEVPRDDAAAKRFGLTGGPFRKNAA